MMSLQPLTWGFAIYRKMELNLEGEIWKDIPAYEGYYQVSNLGRVKSLERFIRQKLGSVSHRPDRILKATIMKTGYASVTISKNGSNRKSFTVHILVMRAFAEVKPHLVVDHINNIRSDNRLENLRYCTSYENTSIFRIRNKHGQVGLEYMPKLNKYRASFWHDGIRYRTSVKATKEEAIEDYKKLWFDVRGYEFNYNGLPENLSLYEKERSIA